MSGAFETPEVIWDILIGLAGTTRVLWEFYVGQAGHCTSPKMTGGKGAVFRQLNLRISVQAPGVIAGGAIYH